ncbi:PspC domain-containing protein [Halobacillus sp. Marseille-Q1614]|uniref:PspC domain-containing protein n=1 Tax=Halobacillus sp. Marseille-Q1614 TaxID=2709134 RepID=UPI00156E0A49|nr:PspC domain-containing protein [Halobacillus sp. Marseille-Q1614]
MKKKLYKSTSNKMLTGTLGGISEIYDIDASLLRILYAVGIFLSSGFLLIVYIVAAIIMPTDQEVQK